MTRAIYNKAIYKRKQQMDRAVYKRARNVLPTGGGSIEPSNQDWYVLKSVQIIDGGAGFPDYDTYLIEEIKTDINPSFEVASVNENGTITEINILEGGLVALSKNDGTLPLEFEFMPTEVTETSKAAKIALNWAPYTNSIPEGEYSEGDPYFELDKNCIISEDGGRPAGGLDYEPTDPNYPNEFRFEVPNGLSDKPAGILGGEITDGVITRIYVVNGGFYPANVFEHYIDSPLIEAVVPGNPGKGCMIFLSFDTHTDESLDPQVDEGGSK